jgi:hypothetical protein
MERDVVEASAPGHPPPHMSAAEREMQFSKEAWPKRKRLWELAYPENARLVSKNPFEKRAIETAKPIGDPARVENWMDKFRQRLCWLKEVKTKGKMTPAKSKKRLIKASTAIDKALRALDAVPPEYLSHGMCDTRDALARESEKMMRFAASIRVQHTGNRVNILKDYAAHFAHDLLDYYIEQPTQTINGAWFSLAALLYEATTGEHITDDQIAKQCQKYLKQVEISLRLARDACKPSRSV